jgi:muramoyltetrapeptide carboxypeptidase
MRGPLFFAGTSEKRLADMHAAFADSETRFIAAIRGGYGSNYLLEAVDLKLIADHPKPFFAYSDMTGLQLWLLDRLGLPAFHGPMVAADFYLEDGVHLESFQAALAGRPYSVGGAEGMRTLRGGSARGTLYGGCLSILVSLIGTPWEPSTENKLLFIEDVGAKPYQVDRMLWQLRQAGKLNDVRGIIFGEMLDCTSPGAPESLLKDAIVSALHGIDIPIAFGLRSGHVSRQNVTLIFGIEAELHAGDEAQLRLLEPAVRS